MSDETPMRGYDDSERLKEMADGIVIRRYASVEEAAKSVLDEDSGSNVDRLRRKFREQNWYERGLSDYVDAEIARRGTQQAEDPSITHFRDGTPRPPRKVAFNRFMANLVRGLMPTGPQVFGLLSMAIASVCTWAGALAPENLALVIVSAALLSLMLWTSEAPKTATSNQALGQLGLMAVWFIGAMLIFRHAMPDPAFTTGSFGGACLLATWAFMTGLYLIGWSKHRRHKNENDFGVELVGAVLSFFAFVYMALSPILGDLKDVSSRTELANDSRSRLERLIGEIQAANPNVDVTKIRKAQEDIYRNTIWSPTWAEGDGN